MRLHTDPQTHRSKGFAHVHFGEEASLDRCAQRCRGWQPCHLPAAEPAAPLIHSHL